MTYYSDIICNLCPRIESCEFPCNKYTDYMHNQSLKNNNISERYEDIHSESITKISYECDDIENFMEFSVGDPEYLQICNGLISPIQAIDFSKLRQYMIEKNEEYSKDYGLCETCHSELQEIKESRGEHFGRESFERIMICTRCGE